MTTVAGTLYVDTANLTAHTFAVPAGVTRSMVVLFIAGTSSGTANPITWTTSGTGTFTAVSSGTATNTYYTVAQGTGFLAGDTITATTPGGVNTTIGHWYDDTIASYGAAAGLAASGSNATQSSGSLTPAAGQRVRVVQVDRVLSAKTVSAVTTTTGETVTVLNYQDSTAGASVSALFAEYTATAATARTASVTMSVAATSVYVAQIPITAVAGSATGGLPPGIKVEVEFTAGTWTDVTADVDGVAGINLKFGRTSEFSTPQVATCSLVLDDLSGKYTALNPASPYYPNIRPRRRLRVSNQYGPRFVGYIRGWPPGFDGVRRIVQIDAYDRMGLLARRTLANTPDSVIAHDAPTWYFPMSDKGSDTSGGLWLAEYQNAVQPLPFFRQQYATGTPHVAGGVGPPTGAWDAPWVQFTAAPLVAPFPQGGWTAKLSDGSTGPMVSGSVWSVTVAYQLTDPTYGGYLWYQQCPGQSADVSVQVGGNPDPPTVYYPSNQPGGSTWLTTTPLYLDTNPHVIHITSSNAGVSFYVDGTLQSSSPYVASCTLGAAGIGDMPMMASIQAFHGLMAHVGIWQNTTLTAAQVAAQAASVLTGFSGETSGSTITRLLAVAGLSPSDMNVMTGSGIMGPYQQTGKTVDAALTDVATSEGGSAVVFVDVDGRVRFNDRTYRDTSTPAMVIDAVLDLDGSALTPGYDEMTLVNESAVTNNTTGTVLTAMDAASIAEFDVTSDQATAYLRLDSDTLNLAQDRIASRSQPRLRLPSLPVDMLTAAGTATYAALAGVSIGSLLRLTNIPVTVIGPSGSPVAYFPTSQLDVYAEGWSETIAVDQYRVVFDASPAGYPVRGIWSTSLWSGSAPLYLAATAGATTMTIDVTGKLAAFTTSGAPFLAQVDSELVMVTAATARSGGSPDTQVLTVTRAQGGTTAAAHSSSTSFIDVSPLPTWIL